MPCLSAHTARLHNASTLDSTDASAVDTVAVAIAQTQEAWSRGRITGALLTDVAAAFPCVARGCLLRNMRSMGLCENRTDSFMRNRRVIMSNRQGGELLEVTTGLPQASPISPVLFAIYITDIHRAVESQADNSRGIFFADDVTWLVEGATVDEVVQRLEQSAAASLRWGGVARWGGGEASGAAAQWGV